MNEKLIKRYEFSVKFSEEDGEWVGTCTRFPSLSHLDQSPMGAIEGIVLLVSNCCDHMQSKGEILP